MLSSKPDHIFFFSIPSQRNGWVGDKDLIWINHDFHTHQYHFTTVSLTEIEVAFPVQWSSEIPRYFGKFEMSQHQEIKA